ncbi:connector enhancer of kinase suppressor of ras 1 [Chelonia mydas]|uniref:connector enhancer of kinase suppressor of ras 1 n=1 Tax=Chelonia mydas TaxID=8469 RepID=UPI0018A1E61B|nr:connector enhancer of kinase suppressor of ras 1 [Chelonia mydas]
MEPIGAWSPVKVAQWLRGLDKVLQQYPFETWSLTGNDLLQLSYRRLEELGLRRVGHQELILEAVEQLCVLNYELETTSLGTLTEKLQQVAWTTRTLILSRRKVTAYDGEAIETPSPDLLACIAELITAAKGLFTWLSRYLFSHLNDYSASRDIVSLCGELAQILQKDCGVSERENRILLICRHLVGICENISSCSPAALLNQTAILESVDLVPTEPEDSLGIEIKSTNSCLHFIAGTATKSPADDCSQILPGDEIVQVNGQVVVGWTRVNLVKKILEKPNQVTLVLKKIPLTSVGSPCSPRSPCHQAPGSFLGAAESPGLESNDSPVSLVPLPSSVIAGLESGLDSALDLATDEEEEFVSSHPREETRDFLRQLPTEGASAAPTLEIQALGAGFEGRSSPIAVTPARPSTLELGSKDSPENGIGSRSRGPESPALPNKSSTKSCSRQKGVATRLSRRRVSCRELGKVDCDGWLLKKKDHVGFMSQKWKRCWFVLKGHILYWYNQPSDEKAVGLINVSTYDLESTREQKKKYVFQLCHEKYKPFVFAAETLADLSMWVSSLITAKTKYKLAQESLPHREEDCYSETEAEDPDDDSPRPGSDLLPRRRELLTTLERAQPGAAMGSPDSTGPVGSPVPGSGRPCSPLDSPGEELESLIKCLKQGGVSLIGTRQLVTHEQYRKSFIKRNKNPQINERVHLVRALQSTLKAKLAELQILNQLLNDSELTSEKFRHWKEEHQELYQEIHQWWVHRPGQAEAELEAELGAESSPQEAAGARP